MGTRLREPDWAATALGPPERWPQGLKNAISVLLPSRTQICLFWGPNFINFYNDAYRPVLGLKHPWALGQPGSEVWKEIWADVLHPLLEGVRRTGEAFWAQDHLFFIERNGYTEETYFDISYDPVPDDRGRVGGVLCIVTETSRRVVSERRMRLIRDIGRLAGEARDGDDAFRRAAAVLAAYPRDLPFALFFDSKMERCIAASGIDPASVPTMALAASAGEPGGVFLDGARLKPFGELSGGPWPEPVRSLAILPIVTAGEAPASYLVAGPSPRLPADEPHRDFLRLVAANVAAVVTAAEARAKERARAEALAELDRAKTAFFSNVSHEFRTPLTLMLGSVEDGLGQDLPPALRQKLEVVHRNGLRLLRLVNTLLEFSRIEAGRAEASFELTDIGTLTAELASSFRSAMERAGLCFATSFEAIAAPVYVDREMWEKIVLNLISNAYKFTLEGEIEVRLRQDGRSVALSVRDTGEGIPESELPRIFERFHRVAGTRGRTHEGTGIGLALVQELARLHGGSATVASTRGKGSTFVVRIPTGRDHLPIDRINAKRSLGSTGLGPAPYVAEALRWLPDDAAGSIPPGATSDAGATVPLNRERLLVADDNADMREYLRRLLAPHYGLEVVPDGEAALAAIGRRRPDLLLTDVMMPGLDGVTLVAAIRSDAEIADLPVIMLSARAGEGASIEALEAGADDYVTKPFGARELLARVRSTLATARLHRQAAQREHESEDALRRMNEVLEERVAERTAALRESERKFRLLVEGVVDYAIFMLDPAGSVTNWNAGAQRIKGYTAAEIVGRHFSVFYTEEDRSDGVPERALATAARTGKFETEGWRVRKGGSRFWASVVIDVIRDETGEIIGFTKITRDMTERRTVEERLRQSQRMEAIGQLTGGVAHDFNNLLTVIYGNLETLLRRLPAQEDGGLRRLAEAASLAASRAARLTQQLLAFSRRQPLEPKPANLNRLVIAASELLQRTLGEAVAIDTLLGAGLWWVQVDPNELENALLNLAVNARDAMPEGGRLMIETANVQLDAAFAAEYGDVTPGPYVMLAVSDTGVGMSKEVLSRAFEPFFTTKPLGQGTGLGLSQVYGFIKQSDGHVKVTSEPGRGTSVRIYLPRLATGAGQVEGTTERVVIPPGREGEAILVVEDDDDVRAHSSEILRELGYRVLAARDGPAALRVIESEPGIRLLFTDVGLPSGMNGRQLADEALRRRPELKVLFTTGYARAAMGGERGIAAGIELVRKPFTYAGLASKVRKVLDATA